MIKMICDICGEEVNNNYNFEKIEVVKAVIIASEESYKIESEKLEVCSDCKFKFEKQNKINEANLTKK